MVRGGNLQDHGRGGNTDVTYTAGRQLIGGPAAPDMLTGPTMSMLDTDGERMWADHEPDDLR